MQTKAELGLGYKQKLISLYYLTPVLGLSEIEVK